MKLDDGDGPECKRIWKACCFGLVPFTSIPVLAIMVPRYTYMNHANRDTPSNTPSCSMNSPVRMHSEQNCVLFGSYSVGASTFIPHSSDNSGCQDSHPCETMPT